LHWDDVEDPEEQIECTRMVANREPLDALFFLLREAFVECVMANSLNCDESDWFRDLLATGREKQIPFRRDVLRRKDPKAELDAGLKAAVTLMNKPPGTPSGVRIITINGSKATARDFTPEEFIRGIPRG
jgi:hypothetical protein